MLAALTADYWVALRLIPAKVFQALLVLFDSDNLRRILATNPAHVVEVLRAIAPRLVRCFILSLSASL